MKADVVVIGTGAAGAVVAGQLSADPACRVVVLEAGGSDANPLFRVPMATGYLAGSTMAAWQDTTAPIPGLGGRRIVLPHGRVMGGSTAINGSVWMRGRPSDFDGWAADGLSGWGWRDIETAYGQIEGRAGAGTGPQPVSFNARRNVLDEAFIEAVRQSGRPYTDDINAPPFEGVSRMQNSVHDGQRWSASRSFLPRDRKNLTIVTGAEVATINIVDGRAVSVSYRQRGAMHTVSAGEIVLSAGTVNSARILMHSGVGPAAHLRDRGIELRVDLPGVGRNLHDHMTISVAHAAREAVSMFPLTRLDNAALAVVRAALFRDGPAADSPFGMVFALRADPDAAEPDVQGIFLPMLNTAIRRPSLKPDGLEGHGFRCVAFAMRPTSRGHLELASDDPFATPIIQPGYLSDPRDLVVNRNAIKLIREIFAQPAFDRYRGLEVTPGPQVSTDAQIDAWIPTAGSTAHHVVGACKMGPDSDPMAVVDDRLRVRGVDGLRIADASVMPRISSGNTMAPTMAIGRRCADFMMGNSAPAS